MGAATTGIEGQVRAKLSEQPVDQDDLVEQVAEENDLDRGEVLRAIRILMERDEVSYTVQWDLQLE